MTAVETSVVTIRHFEQVAIVFAYLAILILKDPTTKLMKRSEKPFFWGFICDRELEAHSKPEDLFMFLQQETVLRGR